VSFLRIFRTLNKADPLTCSNCQQVCAGCAGYFDNPFLKNDAK
jgi:hypothetical protein